MTDVAAYLNQYSPVGDILVCATLFVFFVLMRVTYINKTKPFAILKCIMYLMLVLAYTRLIYFSFLKKAAEGYDVSLRFLMILYCFYYIGVLLILYLFLNYLTEPLHIDPHIAKGHLSLSAAILVAVSIGIVAGTVTGKGYYLERMENGELRIQINRMGFLFGYYLLVFLIVWMTYYYRKRIFKQVAVGVTFTVFMSVVMVAIQNWCDRVSYTLAGFLFPIFALVYLVHSNPYDVEVGTVNEKVFTEIINSPKAKRYIMVELYMHRLEKNGQAYPEGLKGALRELLTKYFRHTLFFQISSGRVILTAEEKYNPGYTEKMDAFLEELQTVYSEKKCEYKAVILTSNEQLERAADYLGLMRHIGGRIPENSAHTVTEEDIREYITQKQILNMLDDIAANKDYEDPRILTYAQPVYNIGKQCFDTAEALARLDFHGEILPPARFIGLSEKSGAIYKVGMIMLNKVCKTVRQLLDDGYRVERISVNFAISDFREPDFCDNVRQIIARSGIPFEKIALEITETQNESDFALLKDKILELKHSGIKFYLDDFGTGYSNYERIMELPFDIIKFDRSLVVAAASGEKSQKMVENMAQLFDHMEYSVLYEGVETEVDAERCRQMYGDYLQGFYYARPVPIEEMKEYFEKGAGKATS